VAVARYSKNVLLAKGQYSGAPQRDFAGLGAKYPDRKTMYAELAPIARKRRASFVNLVNSCRYWMLWVNLSVNECGVCRLNERVKWLIATKVLFFSSCKCFVLNRLHSDEEIIVSFARFRIDVR
jgi:hypothetical protein